MSLSQVSLSQAGKSILARLRSALGRLQKVRKKASKPLIFFGIGVAFVGVPALIYGWYWFHWTGWLLFLFILIEILLLFLLIRAVYTAPWTGFSEKKLWHWMKLLFQAIAAVAIPISIIVGLIQFNAQQDANARTTIQQEKTNQMLALDQQRATTLQTYMDNIQDLLLNRHLLNSNPGDEIRQVAREQTLTTLRRLGLDAERNRIVLRFLRDAHLIGIQGAVINLSDADLNGIDLSRADLSSTDLSRAILSGTNLSGADLNGAHLNSAVLSGAHLNHAFLNDAILSGAILSGANLSDAILNDADLSGIDLSGADLSRAILSDADLSDADLSRAHLNDVALSHANLSYAILNSATLSGADLSYASLSYASLTQPQLDTVYSCTNADLSYTLTISTPLTCHHRGGMVTLTYWYTESREETPVILQRIKQFEQQNPNIKINAMYKPFYETQAAFINASQDGNAPDVLRSDTSWVPQFASQYYLLNIDSFTSESLPDLSAVYLPAPLKYDQYNGHYYGLPQVTDFLALLYNKAELAKVGITSSRALATMADFEKAAMNIVQRKAAPYGFETTGTSYYVLPFLWAFGGGMIDEHNNILVNNKGSVAGLNFLLKLQNFDKVMPAQPDFSNGYNYMVNDFMSGQTAMIFDGPWDVSRILTGSAFKGDPRKLGITAVPMGPSGNQPRSPAGGQSYVISADTAHPAEAYKFISFMSGLGTSQVAIAEANHTLPTLKSVYQDPGVSRDPVLSQFYSILPTAHARPTIPQGEYLFDAFDPNIRAALDGAKSPSDALNAVADAWKQLLDGS